MDIPSQPSASDFRKLMLRLNKDLLEIGKDQLTTGEMATALKISYLRVAETFPDRVQAIDATLMALDKTGHPYRFLSKGYMVQVDDHAFTLAAALPSVLPIAEFEAAFSRHLAKDISPVHIEYGTHLAKADMRSIYDSDLPKGWGKFIRKELETFMSTWQSGVLNEATPVVSVPGKPKPRI